MENIRELFHKPIGNYDFHYLHRQGAHLGNMPLHTHDYYELFLLTSGSLEYTVEGNRYTLKPYDLIVTNPRELHTPHYSEAETGISFISFKRLFLQHVYSEEFNPFRALDARKLGLHNKVEAALVKRYGIDRIFQTIEEKLRVDAPQNTTFVRAQLILLLIALSEAMPEAEGEYTSNEAVNNVIKYINHNLKEDLSSETLSRLFFTERSYLRRLFRAQTGYSISEYVTQKRIITAQALIQNGEAASAAAEAVGFLDYSTFFRNYKKVTGQSPKFPKG